MRRLYSLALSASAVLLLGLTSTGCGSGNDVVPVTGTVTLDGQPLPQAQVVFEPEEGRASVGETDASGRYELNYTGHEKGALRGIHTVRVTTYRDLDPDSGVTQARPERVPLKYNGESTLEVEVPSSSGSYDFELTSDGPIMQPDQLAQRRVRDTD